MIDRELDLVVSRHAPGVCGLYWCNEVPKEECLRDLSDAARAAIAPGLDFLHRHPHRALPAVLALLDFLREEERPETLWSRVYGTGPADLLIPRIALAAGVVRLATAHFHDGTEATFVRRA